MKHPAKHADALRSLHRRLAKEHPPGERWALEPLPALVRGILAEDAADARVDAAVEAIDAEFVDLNELRVATELELHEIVGPKYPAIERRAAALRSALNDVVEREGTLRLDRLRTLTEPGQVRDFLAGLSGVPPYAVAFTLLHAFEVPAMPVDAAALAALADAGAVEPDTTAGDAAAFVEQKLKPADVYDFFTALRAATLGDDE